MRLTRLLFLIPVTFLFLGCESGEISQEIIDTSFLCPDIPEQPAPFTKDDCPVCEECPEQTTTLDGIIMDVMDQIDISNVKMNHYIDSELYEENLAEIVSVDERLNTKNQITLPEYSGKPMKHVLVVEFTQIK